MTAPAVEFSVERLEQAVLFAIDLVEANRGYAPILRRLKREVKLARIREAARASAQ